MTNFSFSASQAEAEKKYNIGKGEYFKVKEGSNKLRLVSECLAHPSEYNGQKTFKWLCQVIDRADGVVKPYFMPTTVFKAIEALQLSEDFSFDGVPMPYDIVVNAKGAGSKEVVYTVMPTKEKPLTKDELEMLASKPTVQDLQNKIYEKVKEPEHKTALDVEEVDFDNIPTSDGQVTIEQAEEALGK